MTIFFYEISIQWKNHLNTHFNKTSIKRKLEILSPYSSINLQLKKYQNENNIKIKKKLKILSPSSSTKLQFNEKSYNPTFQQI